MSNRSLFVIAALLAALLLSALFIRPDNLAPPLDFALRSADGPVKLIDQRGKVALVYFGYTACPDICPTALVSVGGALRQLRPEDLGKVAAFFISVDPERDKPEGLKEYARFFHPAIIGATGTPDEIKRVAQRWRVFYAKQPATEDGRYSVDHSSECFVVGPDGRLIARLPHGSPPEKIVAEIRRALKQ